MMLKYAFIQRIVNVSKLDCSNILSVSRVCILGCVIILYTASFPNPIKLLYSANVIHKVH